eukprot:GHVS01090927.1.p1 GENE.GHVS01090927.1~~GHVS01090927.1.p1  ORF type:complete len:463 (-),score=49.02 GHVS01090927.1:99-1487(-)
MPSLQSQSTECSSADESPAKLSFETLAIHSGQTPDPTTRAIIPPIYMTSTYVQEYPTHHKGFDYTRAGNPTFTALEKQLASLEGGEFCTVFSSGLAAVTSVLMSQMTGQTEGAEVIAFRSCYGGTFRLLKKILLPTGVKTTFMSVDMWEQELRALLKEDETEGKPVPPKRLFLFETPTNPLLEVIDIAAVVELCKAHNILTVVDNTFATPYLQRPLEFGVDVSLQSCTKYIGGHSDVLGGCAVTNSAELFGAFNFYRMSMGFNPSPFDCWLLSRSLKTLAIRIQRHSENALVFAEHMSKHSHVRSVCYPGLPSDRYHDVATKQMHNGGFGGMVAMEFRLSEAETMELISSMKVFCLAESLGGVESLVEHPASMTHASIPKDERAAAGISDALVRFSVGIEDVNDLINDVESAIDRVLRKRSTTGGASAPTDSIKHAEQQPGAVLRHEVIEGPHVRHQGGCRH